MKIFPFEAALRRLSIGAISQADTLRIFFLEHFQRLRGLTVVLLDWLLGDINKPSQLISVSAYGLAAHVFELG